ncbi:hypothetical protein ACFC4S_28380 [Priestia megaterium]|uniref:hypothetical protein n=1 Tax=Priestia megaterium TaxID=1404 RepID=UPI0035D8628C
MATAKKAITKSKSQSETEKKLEDARKKNRARRATIKKNEEKKTGSKKTTYKSKGEGRAKTTQARKTKINSTSTAKKSSPSTKSKVAKNTTSRSTKKKTVRKTRKRHPVLIHMMDLPRWARFIIYAVVLTVVLYGYYLYSKEQLGSTLIDFLNQNIFIIAPLILVLVYSLTLFYLGYKAGVNR